MSQWPWLMSETKLSMLSTVLRDMPLSLLCWARKGEGWGGEGRVEKGREGWGDEMEEGRRRASTATAARML